MGEHNQDIVDVDVDPVDLDFDEAWAEEDARAPKVRIMGEVFTLPGSIPAALVLFTYRVRTGAENSRREVDPGEIVRMAGTLLGPDRVQELMDRGLGFDRLTQVIFRCMAIYKQRNNRAGEGEALAPTATTPEPTPSDSSSATGASSSPTGAASTTAPISTPSYEPA